MTERTEKMAEKIEWYKEVLELEPNSRVFFPLARLLVEASRQEEAAHVLEHGLARHGEFLEARLFLIEILHSLGRREACAAQVDKLSQMLSSYAGFWQAWATWLSETRGAADAASALRFLAANLACGPLSLRDVIDRGVESLMAGASGVAAQPCGRSQQVQPAAGMAVAPVVEPTASPVAGGGSDAAADGAEEDSVFEAPADELFDPDLAMADDSPLPEQADADMDMVSVGEGEAVSPMVAPVLADIPAQFGQLQGEDGEERFSLRTRSMAEVLAEQGDIGGALDIYHELEAVATSAEELAELQARISVLTASLGGHEAMQDVEPEIVDSPAGKNKLIGILEALAERVEARAHG